jgi:hypothetical protein
MRVTDLRAAETGENLQIEFTIPMMTTEGLPLKTLQSIELRVAVSGGKESTIPVAGAAPGAFAPLIPAREWIGKEVTLMVRATGPKNKASDWSNFVTLGIEPPLATPLDVKAVSNEQGVLLTWRGSASRYRIFRSQAEQQPQPAGESDHPEFSDPQAQIGTAYRYYVQAVAGASQASEVAGPISITPKDEFPPAVPAGLTVDAGVNTIELSWQRNTEADFQGYNVYRSVEGGPFEKIASLIPVPAYRDLKVESGKKYRYAISAVDTTGLESKQSSPVESAAQ